MALGVLGLVVFWGTMVVVFFLVWRYLSASTPEPDTGGSFATYVAVGRIASVVALTVHVFGLVVIMKAPPAKRKGGVVLNGLALILLLGIKFFGPLWHLSQ